MAQTAIEGKNVVLEGWKDNSTMGIDSFFQPFVCATSVEFYYDTELIERATVGMAGFKGFRPGMGEWGIRLNTVTHIVPPSGVAYTVFDTIQAQLRKNGLDIRLQFADILGNFVTITGHVMIPHTGITSPADGFSEDDIEFKGDGAFALSTIHIDPITPADDVKKIEYTATGGETTLTYPALISRNILYVGRSGVALEVITAGTPTSLQVFYTSSTGSLTFGSPLNPEEWVLILYK